MNINDKIKQILIDKNLTPSYFADEIGVQRSSISHILSGRNRPSFDIIQKIIRRFPELGYEWIMEEESQLPAQPVVGSIHYGAGRSTLQQPTGERRDRFVNQPAAGPYAEPSIIVRSQRSEIPAVPQQPQAIKTNVAETVAAGLGGERKIEKILIFYTDGSFREYGPAGN